LTKNEYTPKSREILIGEVDVYILLLPKCFGGYCAIAPRIPDPREGDLVQFSGEYEWNVKGGVIHYTHRATGGTHISGWLEHAGKRYQ
jgi:hypothetical protein